MSTQNIKDVVLLFVLPKEPQLRHELETINETISNEGDHDVALDFSGVEIITSSSISNLTILHNLLCERGRKLILCNVALPIRGLFSIAGLSGFFSFADDKFAALARLQSNQLAGSRSAKCKAKNLKLRNSKVFRF